jgi:hypothetical protein
MSVTTEYVYELYHNGQMITIGRLNLPSVSDYAYKYIANQCAENIATELDFSTPKYWGIDGSVECELELYTNNERIGRFKVLLQRRLTCSVVS